MSHDEAFLQFQKRGEASLDEILEQFRIFIEPLSKEMFLKPNRQNMLDRRKVERVWSVVVVRSRVKLTQIQYQQGFSRAWEMVRQQKLMVGGKG